jgi:hypothetical protein
VWISIFYDLVYFRGIGNDAHCVICFSLRFYVVGGGRLAGVFESMVPGI